LGSFCEGKKQPKPPEPIAVEHDPQELLWVRFVIFMIQGRAESSSANGAAQLFGFVRGLQNCGERDATGTRGDADRVRLNAANPSCGCWLAAFT